MRVITGKYRGRPLVGPKHAGLRPTAERVREALFNIISTKIINASWLDLFAGTGAVGIEALSRGASSVVLVDDNYLSVKLIKTNLKVLEQGEPVHLLSMSAARAVNFLAQKKAQFDLIFLDPPFEANLLRETMALIAAKDLLRTDGWLIAEHDKRLVEMQQIPDYQRIQTREYGDLALTFFNKA